MSDVGQLNQSGTASNDPPGSNMALAVCDVSPATSPAPPPPVPVLGTFDVDKGLLRIGSVGLGPSGRHRRR